MHELQQQARTLYDDVCGRFPGTLTVGYRMFGVDGGGGKDDENVDDHELEVVRPKIGCW